MKIGDLVRFEVGTDDGFTERHYAPIVEWRKRNGCSYRSKTTNPYAAYLEPEYTGTQVLPLTELTPAVDDFEIVTSITAVQAGAREWHGFYYKCLRCGLHTYKGATVMVVHKVSGERVRLCEDCYRPEELTRLGHSALWDQRRNKTTILELRAAPELITGPAGDSSAYYDRTDADTYREWADTFPWLMPARAAELYAQWKEQQSAAAA